MIHTLRRLILVRHGETDWNREGRLQGLTDAPLNDTGRAQARALADRLRDAEVDAVYASPLVRAAETASIVAAALDREVTPVPDLRERDVGAWGGLTADEIRVRHAADWARYLAGDDAPFGGGETRARVRDRMAAAVAELASRHPGGTVLVVSHGLALKLLVSHLLGLDVRDSDRLATGANTGVTTFDVRHGVPRLAGYADASHLDAPARVTAVR